MAAKSLSIGPVLVAGVALLLVVAAPRSLYVYADGDGETDYLDYDYFYDAFDYFDYDSYNDDYFENSYKVNPVCLDETTVNPNVTRPCDLRVEGSTLATKLDGGLDGLYAFMGCSESFPWYKRVGEHPEGGERYILYSTYWGDWDFTNASSLSDDSTVGYGGTGDEEDVPELVPPYAWNVLTALTDQQSDDDFVADDGIWVYCNYNCTDGIQNGDELGVDCGGLDCEPCESGDHLSAEELRYQQEALQRLKSKVSKEQAEFLTPFQQTMMAFVIVFATCIVCGGPMLYLLKQNKKQQYTSLDEGIRRKRRTGGA